MKEILKVSVLLLAIPSILVVFVLSYALCWPYLAGVNSDEWMDTVSNTWVSIFGNITWVIILIVVAIRVWC